ncbi:MAG: hypothetical protein HQK94_19085 [Nitrospirae bacterium]|nr:hypothetical protein [Nitrospirota bacterium]
MSKKRSKRGRSRKRGNNRGASTLTENGTSSGVAVMAQKFYLGLWLISLIKRGSAGVDKILQEIKETVWQGQIKSVGCIEAVYAGLFAYSCYLIISTIVKAIRTISAHHGSLFNNLSFHAYFSVAVFSGILLQFMRMYYYLHLFDQKQEDKNHFIAQMGGEYKIKDVVYRFLAAATVIISVKLNPSKLINYVEDICCGNKLGDVGVLISFALAIILLFLFLLGWDVNLHYWVKNNPGESDNNGLAKFHPKLKLGQRVSGLFFSLIYFITLKYIGKCVNSTAVAFFYAFTLSPFIGTWGYEYLHRYKEYRKKPIQSIGKKIFVTIGHEFFSPLITMWDLLKYATGTNKSSGTSGG